ncbi:hypothetical protein LJC49_09310 [Ruminococcaceae bacterium OttesenSCG-928-I18]|nr:hypothetical protein [Ruminococcaceae bacterium OttesenSCG-928-I18]
MADQPKGSEYDQYAPQTNGRLFSNAMFGFNKEEVLEYLEELADENYQRQEAAEQRIRELDMQIKNLEARAAVVEEMPQGQMDVVEESRRQLAEVSNSLEVARSAAQQAEEELAEYKEQLYTAQNENNWLREEFQKSDKQVAELRRQLDDASQGQWFGAEEQIAELRRQLEEVMAQRDTIQAERDAAEAEREAAEAERDAAEAERDAAEAERDAMEAERDAMEAEREAEVAYAESPAGQAASTLIAEATEEAERIRESAYAERDRIHRQILNSAGGLSESIGSLREDITGVEGDVTEVLENVQETLAELLVSLGRTEQNLTTLGVQAERFPSAATPVANQQVVYFQPGPQVSADTPPQTQGRTKKRSPKAKTPEPAQSYGSGGFRRVWPDEQGASAKTQPFRPTFSNSPTASGAYLTQTARALPREEYEYDPEGDRMRALTETLVDTLRQMLD